MFIQEANSFITNELKSEIDALRNDLKTVERLAHEKLNCAKPEETVVYFAAAKTSPETQCRKYFWIIFRKTGAMSYWLKRNSKQPCGGISAEKIFCRGRFFRSHKSRISGIVEKPSFCQSQAAVMVWLVRLKSPTA